MNIHCFKHVSFEGLGCIEEWITKNNHTLTFTKFYNNHPLPDIKNIDFINFMSDYILEHKFKFKLQKQQRYKIRYTVTF